MIKLNEHYGSDFVPTTQQLEVHERLRGLLNEYQARMATIREQDIVELNRMLSENGLPTITTEPEN